MRFNRHIRRLMCAGAVLCYVGTTDALGGRGLPCLFRTLLGIECFGCGLTRAAAALLHGRIADAVALNAFIVPSAAIAAWEFLVAVFSLSTRRSEEYKWQNSAQQKLHS